MAGLLGGFLLLAVAPPAGATVPGGPYLPNRYHCDYNGHGYHRCDGGLGQKVGPGFADEGIAEALLRRRCARHVLVAVLRCDRCRLISHLRWPRITRARGSADLLSPLSFA